MTTKPRPAYRLYDDEGNHYPDSDGEPLPDGFEQDMPYLEIRWAVQNYFHARSDVVTSGNTFIYYERGNPRRSISPDCYVAFGVSREAVARHNSYWVWDVGKPPDFALEIGSSSTGRRDTGYKRTLYAQIGIGEYWRYDPTPDSKHYGEKLVGERLVNGEYQRFPLETTADGRPWGHSPTLGLDLCWAEEVLHFYDPAAGQYLPTSQEQVDALRAAENARQVAENARQVAENARQVAENARQQEAVARQAAEAEAAELREQLRRLRGG